MFSYDTSWQPPAPCVRLCIFDNRLGVRLGPFPALVDTGADCSCLPKSIRSSAPRLDYEFAQVLDFNGQTSTMEFVRILDATVELLDGRSTVRLRKSYSNLRLLVVSDGILGRDILNQHAVSLIGPGLRWNIE